MSCGCDLIPICLGGKTFYASVQYGPRGDFLSGYYLNEALAKVVLTPSTFSYGACAAAGPGTTDFWRSAPGATALPDGVTDITENIRRNGNVGLLADPVSTLDVAGSVGANIVTVAAAAYTLLPTDHTIILTSGPIGQLLTLPAAGATNIRRLVRLVNPTAFGKTYTPAANGLSGGASTSIPINASVLLQSDGVNWNEIEVTRLPATTANFSQIVASGGIDLGDPVPFGPRPLINLFNVASAVGLDSSASDARLQVNFLTPATSVNYIITGSIRSQVAAAWNTDNDMVWHVVSKSTTGFVISTRELNAGVQNLFFDFECSTFQSAPATLALPEIAQFVALDTPVTLDNIRLEARLTGGQGIRISTVIGTIQATISAVTSFATDSVFSSNRANIAVTTVMTHPFIWTGQTTGDGMTGQIIDHTNNKVYTFVIVTMAVPLLCFIQIKRLL